MTPGDLTLCLPTTWRRLSHLPHGVVVNARATIVPASGVPPEVVVRCATVDADLHAWRAGAIQELSAVLVDLEVEDEDEFRLVGEPVAYHRFAHRLGSADVLSDQWSWLDDGLGVTLTCSAARVDYPAYCDVFEAIAETVRIGPRAA